MKKPTADESNKPSLGMLIRIKKEIHKKNFWELIRYLLMGGIGALSYLLFSNFYNWLGVSTYLSPFYAWASGLAIVYFGHMKFTYKVKARHKQMLFRFLMMQSCNLGMSTFSTVVVRDWLDFPYFVASVAALVTTVPVLYILGKYWVYQSGQSN